MFVAGNLWKDDSIPRNWTYLLEACGILDAEGYEDIVNDFGTGQLTDRLKNFFIGKKIKTLQFVNKTYTGEDGIEKPSYTFWNMNADGFNYPNLWSIETDNEVIIKEFEKKCNSNYPPPYHPEILDELKKGEEKETDDEYQPATDDELM